MKSVILITFILIAQTNAFFGEFDSGRISNGFESLITDMRDHVDCTMFAFERVLTLSGIIEASRNRCGSYSEYGEPEVEPEPEPVEEPVAYLAQEINTGVDNTDRELFYILQKRQIQQKLDEMESNLHLDADRLQEIRNFILSGQQSFSLKAREEFIENLIRLQSSSEENINPKFKVVQEREDLERKAEVEEIRHTLDEIVSILNKDKRENVNKEDSKPEQINTTPTPLNENNDQLISEWKEEKSARNQEIQDRINQNIPESLNDIKDTIFKENIGASTGNQDFKEKPSATDTNLVNFNMNTPEIKETYFASFSELNPKDESQEKQVVQQASQIMQENQYAQLLMANVFNNPDTEVEDVFGSSGVFSLS